FISASGKEFCDAKSFSGFGRMIQKQGIEAPNAKTVSIIDRDASLGYTRRDNDIFRLHCKWWFNHSGEYGADGPPRLSGLISLLRLRAVRHFPIRRVRAAPRLPAGPLLESQSDCLCRYWHPIGGHRRFRYCMSFDLLCLARRRAAG